LIESTDVGTYIDPIIIDAVNAIETLVGLETDGAEYSSKVKETRTTKALLLLSSYFENFFKLRLSKKTGIVRKHVFGSSTHFSFRGVISSITEPHKYGDIHLPWAMANALLRPHLINKLMSRGFKLTQAINFLHSHSEVHHPLLEEIHTQLLYETGRGGLHCIITRNPSLTHSSAQFLRISKIKTDPADFTIGLSILIVRGYNADFDGDALNGMLAIDEETIKAWYCLSPHSNIFELTTPKKMAGNNSIPKPVLATMANWLTDIEETDTAKQELMQQLLL
jgi:hypothetical protein